MPIGNQEIWDKGIGAGATNVVFGGGDTQPSSTNFNPGALGADPTQKPADPAAPAAPAAPELGTPATPAAPTGPTPQQVKGLQNLQATLIQAQTALQNAMLGHLHESQVNGYRYRVNKAQEAISLYKLKNGM